MKNKTLFLSLLILINSQVFSQINIFDAVISNNTKALETTLKQGENPNQYDSQGFSPLLFASGYGFIDCAKILLKYKADINLGDSQYGTTPLMMAAKQDKLEMCMFLMQEGADINKADKQGYSSTDYANLSKDEDVINYINNPQNFSYKDLQLFFPIKKNNTKKLSELLKNGADPNHENSFGNTPLMFCAISGQIQCAKILIKYGANVNYTEKSDNKTALMYAVYGNQYEMCDLLLKNNADTTIKTKNNKSVLYYAQKLADSTNCKNVLELIEKYKKYKFDIDLETWTNINWKLKTYENTNNIFLLKKWIRLAEQKAKMDFKQTDTNYFLTIYNLQEYNYIASDTQEIEKNYLMLEKLVKKSYGKTHKYYFIIIGDILNFYNKTDNIEKIKSYADKYYDLMNKFYTKTNSLYIDDLHIISKIYKKIGENEKAQKALDKIKELNF